MTQCKEEYVPDDFGVGFHRCRNKASMASGYCRTHDPECIKAREAKRPPTKFEREVQILLAKQKIEKARDAELAELRAYRGRTEAALRAWCDDLTQFLADAESGGDERMVLFTRSEIEDWKEAGLWRDKEPQP